MHIPSKSKTIMYIFCLTIVPQFSVIAVVASVACWAYWANKYNDFLIWLPGIIGFIAMLFTFVCVSVLVHAYGLSIFAKTRKEFNSENYKGTPVTKIEYTVGRKDTLTGNRPIYVRTKQVSSGGPLLIMGGQALLVGITGFLKFIIETIRVCLSDNRQAEWEACREYMKQKMSGKSKVSFFQLPIICGMIIALIWVSMLPIMIYMRNSYDPRNIEFNITEKDNSEFNNIRINILFNGEITNKGNKKIEQLEGTLYFKNRRGDVLYEGKTVINAPFSTRYPSDDYLEKNESWEICLDIRTDPSHSGAWELWDCDLEDIEISMEISEIRYKGSKFIEFSVPQSVTVKTPGN